MQIRTRLTLQFAGIVAVIVLISHIAIYYFSAQYRENQFYDRLRDKANTTAELLIKVDAVDAELLRVIDANKKDLLFQENITVYNYKNEIVYTNNDSADFGNRPEFLDRIRLEGEQRISEGQTELVGIQYIDQYNRFVVTASAIDQFGLKKLHNLRNILAISFILMLGIVALTGWIYSGRALRPISRIIDSVNRISATNLEIRLDEGNRKDEIARLSATFNEMLARIETTFQMQKAFVANASHEIKNPLTVITSQVEVILLRERTPEEYRQTLASVLDDVRRLNEVSLRLLDLARLSSDEIKVDFTNVRIDELIWHCKETLSEKYPDCRIVFTPRLPDEEHLLIVKANEYLLRIAFLNLMENAYKFSATKEIQINLEANDNSCTVQLVDKGVGIPEADLPFIFEPFYRGQNAVAISGHGIGLSLVDKIVRIHKAQIKVTSQQGRGTTFTLEIPSVPVL